jgi:hypothetical protein
MLLKYQLKNVQLKLDVIFVGVVGNVIFDFLGVD